MEKVAAFDVRLVKFQTLLRGLQKVKSNLKIQTLPNHTLEPTRVGAFGSAVADDTSWSRVAQLCR